MKNPTTVMQRPRWPAVIIPEAAWVDYSVVADEFLVFFGGKPVPAFSDHIDAPGYDHLMIMVGLHPDHTETGEVVGIHIEPMMHGAILARPEWSILTWAVLAGEYGTELVQERLPIFIAEVAEAFEKYWKPAPPIEEQLAAIRQANQTRQTA